MVRHYKGCECKRPFSRRSASMFLPHKRNFRCFPSRVLIRRRVQRSQYAIVNLNGIIRGDEAGGTSNTPRRHSDKGVRLPTVLLANDTRRDGPLHVTCRADRVWNAFRSSRHVLVVVCQVVLRVRVVFKRRRTRILLYQRVANGGHLNGRIR